MFFFSILAQSLCICVPSNPHLCLALLLCPCAAHAFFSEQQVCSAGISAFDDIFHRIRRHSVSSGTISLQKKNLVSFHHPAIFFR